MNSSLLLTAVFCTQVIYICLELLEIIFLYFATRTPALTPIMIRKVAV